MGPLHSRAHASTRSNESAVVAGRAVVGSVDMLSRHSLMLYSHAHMLAVDPHHGRQEFAEDGGAVSTFWEK